MLAGCYICFFMSHQKVGIAVRPSSNSSSVVVYGSSNRNDYGYRERLSRLSRQLADLHVQSPVEMKNHEVS
jgi:cytochrome c biogenesis protein